MHRAKLACTNGRRRTFVDREERLGQQLDPVDELVAVAEGADRGAERRTVPGRSGSDRANRCAVITVRAHEELPPVEAVAQVAGGRAVVPEVGGLVAPERLHQRVDQRRARPSSTSTSDMRS